MNTGSRRESTWARGSVAGFLGQALCDGYVDVILCGTTVHSRICCPIKRSTGRAAARHFDADGGRPLEDEDGMDHSSRGG